MVRIMSFAKVRMPASGLLISWAMEAESFPREESFSVRTSVSCAARSSPVRSSTFSLELLVERLELALRPRAASASSR